MISDLETERIKAGIRRIALNHTRKLTDGEVTQWANELRPYAGQKLAKVLEDFALGTEFPNVGEIRAKYFAESKADAPFKSLQLTPDERKKANNAALKSMLWLHYVKRWRLEDFAGTTLAAAFGGDPKPHLERAKEAYSRELIERWMADQIAQGN
jgi:hypothetical protein